MADTIIKSPNDLTKIKEKVLNSRKKIGHEIKEKIMVCMGGGCIASGSQKVKEALEKAIIAQNLTSKVQICNTGCLGPCVKGPIVHMQSDDTFYQNVAPEDCSEIVKSHILNNTIVDRLTWKKDGSGDPIHKIQDIQFFNKQKKIALINCGNIDPLSIEDYIGNDGYAALGLALSKMTPEKIIDEIKISGLRGRGGAGFPTYLKWSLAQTRKSDKKYIICNADEGDPGAFMDRSLLEGDPHSIIEGMAIGAFTIGANTGYIYVRAEYPLAVERLQYAIDEATKIGLLGKNILGSKFCFDLEIRMGSGAFVCGEETALINSIEGKRGEPRCKPPFPVESGLWGKPTVINNVETYANIPYIILHGGKEFGNIGTERSKGTKVFALAGTINISGLVEVPIGTSLGELIYDIGGGIPGDKIFKAAQIGGPSGGCIPKDHLNVKLDYESLNELGAIMGSGGLIVMDEDSCMVDVARFFLEFVQEESCGKCAPCRIGTKRMLEIIERICSGNGHENDIELLINLGQKIKETSLCGLGQSAPNPVLSTIRYFREEYEQHINNKHCEAGVCSGVVRASCQSACPAHVDIPGFVSLIGEKRYAEALALHRERNPFAAVCSRVCFHTCEKKCKRSAIDDAVSIRALKRFMVDQEITIQTPEIKNEDKNSNRKIAIIGAGPSGLTCAYFLARMGYKPKVFESEIRPGGMLIQTIPAYRLPREILSREIRMIENMGVEIEYGKKLGKDFLVEDLKNQGFEAVYVAIGSPVSIGLNIPGKNAKNVANAIDFLTTYNLRGSVPVGKNIVVVGGGNAAIDSARTAMRLDAESVTVIYRRTMDEMPAYPEEIEEALQEGIKIMTLTNPNEFILDPKEQVVGIKCNYMSLGEFDTSGRKRPINNQESFIINCDQVILALGQKIDISLIDVGTQVQMVDNSAIQVNPYSQQTSIPWIFAGGDITATGEKTVILAIAAGERAAVGIDGYLTGKNNAFWREEKPVSTYFDPDADPSTHPRAKLPLLSIEKRKNNFAEVEMPWLEPEAIRQAHRCLRCDFGK
jgi:NADH-quinone oxidoreductase subunit F